MNKKDLLLLAKEYSTNKHALFKDDATFEQSAGYKFVKHKDGVHLCFTNKATMPDFLIEEGREDKVLDWLKEAGIPESKAPTEALSALLMNADKEKETHKAVDFTTTVTAGSNGIKMPTGEFLGVSQIKPSLPFLGEIVYYSMVSSKHMVIYEYDSDFKLHISPLLYRPEDWRVDEVHDKETKKEHNGSGLFF